ncbi:MAG TPA: AraC family transcriptional regulator [Puia sp.]|nr:AraC family transcriptional regulator [Puia sp.]
MLVRALPKTFNPDNEITPPIYVDHFLFSEVLRKPYQCPEHPSGIGLLIAEKGICNYYVNGMKNPIEQNKVFFVNRGSRLAIKTTDVGVTPTMLFFNSQLPDLVQHSLIYSDEVLLENFDNLPYDFSYLERVHVDGGLRDTILSLIELGSSCSSFANIQADAVVRALFEDLLKANREAYKCSQNIQAVKASTRLEIFRRVSLARNWMEENFNTAITLEDIAAMASMNSQHFLRMFKQVYCITPHQYLIDCKLRKAKHLLETTRLTMNDICLAIGFESVFSFSILYKKRFGRPPSQLRKGE